MTTSTMFNESVKDEFLNLLPENSRKTYKRVFIKSFPTELQLDKDLFDFNKDEIELVLHDLTPLTHAASRSNGTIITSYISWCIDKHIKHSEFNPLKTMDKEWFEKFVDNTVKLYFSESEIREVESFCENAQDAVIIRLYFEGLSGKDSSEIRYLHKNDINFNDNTLKLRNEFGNIHRELIVSDRAIKLIGEALDQKQYINRNGLMDDSSGNVKAFNDLLKNDYVLRNSATKSDNFNGAVHSSVIYRRMKTISETLGIPFFTGKNVLRSGAIYHAFKLINRDATSDLTTRQYEEIAERYGVNSIYSMKAYCNMENINELYMRSRN